MSLQFGKRFTDHTTVSLSLQDDLSEDVKRDILKEQERILSKVKEYVDNNLNPRKSTPYKENMWYVIIQEEYCNVL